MAKNKALAKASAGAVSIDAKMSDDMDKHEINRHMDTISDAFDIMNDPVKMKKVKAMVGRKHKAIKSLSDLKEIRNQKAMEEKDGEME